MGTRDRRRGRPQPSETPDVASSSTVVRPAETSAETSADHRRSERHDQGDAAGGPPAAGGDRNPRAGQGATQERLWRAGRTGWALIGLAGVLAITGWLASQMLLVVIPVILALFPASLLSPVATWMKERGVPPALAALVSIIAGIAIIAGVIGAMVPLVAAEIPELADSAAEGVQELENLLEDGIFGVEFEGLAGLLDMAQEQLPETGELAAQAIDAAVVAFEVVAGILLLLVVLFFYLKDGPRLARGVITTAPPHLRPKLHGVALRAWDTLGSYFRGQLLVAFVDAVFIGIGLLILGVPLALPLAVLIFFGGLFPIVGAVTTGALAVLVALADTGLTTALIVLGLVLAVQQLESNILEPIILSKAINLHPVMILISITAGAVTLGILGAFLAVPVASTLARIIAYLREDAPDDDRAEDAEEAVIDLDHPVRAES